MYSKNIFIFSDKIGSGKTTTLSKWVATQENIGGFLSQKINGKRHFLHVETGEKRLMESKNSVLKIGKYQFDPNVFRWAEEEIYKQFSLKQNIIIIDEIGPLEIRKNQGFKELLLKIFNENSSEKPPLIFVIRDFMVSEFLEKYQLTDAKILPKNYFENQILSPLKGIVLCGGESTRMKTDKALLRYQNNENQWRKNEKILLPFCDEVAVSVNENQWNSWAKNEKANFVKDTEKYQNNGPLSGLMSVWEQFPNNGFFILGIDYPFLETHHLIALYNARDEQYEAVCFEKDGFNEPLISILEEKATAKLNAFFENGGKSINQFLTQINTRKITPENTDFLKNSNTEEDFRNFRTSYLP